jgi:indole-3-glycerol phosphate synthase
MILDAILEEKRREIEGLRRLGKRPERREERRDFAAAIARKPGLNLIAEIKRASPSRGRLRESFDPAEIARACEESGAAALSVLTEEKFFQGSLEHLRAAREASRLPVLRKDFILDEVQLHQTAGEADAVLLIVRLLSGPRLGSLLRLGSELGLACLVEVHDEADLERALEAGASLIGINNRNLDTFQVDLETTRRLRPCLPEGKVVVSESGISTRQQVVSLQELGVDAILVGEALMRSENLPARIGELLGRQ